MDRLIYIPPGTDENDTENTLELGGMTPCRLASLTGLGAVETNAVTMRMAGQDGAHLQNVTLGPRTVAAAVKIVGRSRAEMLAYRERLIRILNPKRGAGTLYYENGRGRYRIEAVATQYGAQGEDAVSRVGNVTVEFFCASPYWYAADAQRVRLYEYRAGDAFPASFPLTLQNTWYTPVVVCGAPSEVDTTVAASGPFRDFTVVNRREGQRLTVRGAVERGETLILEGAKERAYILRPDGAVQAVVPEYGYAYPSVRNGINELGVAFGIAGDGAAVTLEWADKYAGL